MMFLKMRLLIGSLVSGAMAFLLFLVSCRSGENSVPPLFDEIPASSSGVEFSNALTEDEEFNLIEYLYFYNGGGVALGDINNDGLVDIYLSANQQENKLYLNKGNWIFEDITEKAGVASSGAWKTGVTMADVNGDGLLDIYQCRLGNYKGIEGKNQLFINNGDLTFSEQAEAYGLDFRGFSTQAAFFDYDLDGDLDMYLLNHSVHTERSYGRAILRQYDDAKAGDRLFKNDSENGAPSFRSVTKEAGIYSSHIGYGLGIGISDINADGWPDIYISNDFNENDYLYLNNGAKAGQPVTFTESIASTIGHTSRFSMGNDLADYNNDGLTDIISLDMLPEDEVVLKRSAGEDSYEIYSMKLQFGYGQQFARNTLQLNMGSNAEGVPQYAEIGQLAGIHATDWSWSALFADYDNDGYKDLFISNGIKRRPNDMDYINFLSDHEIPDGLVKNPGLSDLSLLKEMPDGSVPNYFFKNNRDLTFSNVSTAWGMTAPSLSNGAAYADLDNDGDLDLVVNNIDQPASILRNYTMENSPADASSWLKIIASGSRKNTFGIGLRAMAYFNGQLAVQENFTTRGFQSSVTPRVHLGLGSIRTLDSLRIVWPGGKTQLLEEVAVNRTIQVEESEAMHHYAYPQKTTASLLKDYTAHSQVDFTHTENSFNDFNREFLIPHSVSREGPEVAVADFNGDGKEDFYVSNASGASGGLFFQGPNATFYQGGGSLLAKGTDIEETALAAFDADGDKIQDLYIASAGNEAIPPSPLLKDRLLINSGNGEFAESSGLPEKYQHASVVVSADVDQDGDLDLFVGGRVVPGQYGTAPESYLLINDGRGNFEDRTSSLAPGLAQAGMVKDAKWIDLNSDSYPELILAGEWMPLTIYNNQNGTLIEATAKGLEETSGWWNCIEAGDFDNDGDIDFVAGNLGSNSKLKPSVQYPLHLFSKDFDSNGSADPILAYSTPEGVFPVHSRDELIRQIPSLKKKFVQHADFAGKTVSEIFGDAELRASHHLQAYTFSSVYLDNLNDGAFRVHKLPLQAQFFPIMAMAVADIDRDGNLDILAGGNLFSVSPYFGTYDAGKGLLMTGDGKGNFNPLPMHESGFSVDGEIKDIKILPAAEKLLFFIARNNKKLLIYQLNGSIP